MKMIRRILPVVLVLTLVLSCMTAALASGTVYYTTGKVHMRVSPDKESRKLKTLPYGTKFTATDTETDSRGVVWCYGKYNGTYGWVSTKYLSEHKPKATAKPTPKPVDYSSFEGAGYYVKVTADSLNMRKAPGVGYDVIDSYPKGTVLYASKTNGSWYEVLDEEKKMTGYMAASYLVQCEAPVAEEAVEAEPIYGTVYGVTKSWDAATKTLVVTETETQEDFAFVCSDATTISLADYQTEGTEVVVFYSTTDEAAREGLTALAIA